MRRRSNRQEGLGKTPHTIARWRSGESRVHPVSVDLSGPGLVVCRVAVLFQGFPYRKETTVRFLFEFSLTRQLFLREPETDARIASRLAYSAGYLEAATAGP